MKWTDEEKAVLRTRLNAGYIPVTESGCWLWTKATIQGYGTLKYRGMNHRSHRLMYELERGPIPDELVIDHLCRVTYCINPDHLEPVTTKVNTLRGVGIAVKNAVKIYCPSGHELNGRNILPRDGKRDCRKCDLDRQSLYRKRMRLAIKEAKRFLSEIAESRHVELADEAASILKLFHPGQWSSPPIPEPEEQP